ncbi:MAG: succinylglutamate desuccinylase [Opitutaceae bacterium]|nr:succinylglutamate desuccinylase [Opitutaceae bacterium]
MLAFTKHTPGPRPRIYISSGIHGDEPAPPIALLSLIHAGFFDDRANWFLCPVINPTGLQIGTREDHQERDLNRDFLDRKTPEIHALTRWLNRQPCFDLCICLHEDWESQGYYLYEVDRRDRPAYAAEILASVKTALPIESATTIDERPIDEPGIIRPVSDPLLRKDWPETIYLINHHTSLDYTLETPSAFTMGRRILAHKLALEAALKAAIRDFG